MDLEYAERKWCEVTVLAFYNSVEEVALILKDYIKLGNKEELATKVIIINMVQHI